MLRYELWVHVACRIAAAASFSFVRDIPRWEVPGG